MSITLALERQSQEDQELGAVSEMQILFSYLKQPEMCESRETEPPRSSEELPVYPASLLAEGLPFLKTLHCGHFL